jgi:hypothetical protein
LPKRKCLKYECCPLRPAVILCTTKFNIQNIYVTPTDCVNVFGIDIARRKYRSGGKMRRRKQLLDDLKEMRGYRRLKRKN